jgi:hypothetical protein
MSAAEMTAASVSHFPNSNLRLVVLARSSPSLGAVRFNSPRRSATLANASTSSSWGVPCMPWSRRQGDAAIRIFTFTIFETHALPLRLNQHHIADKQKTLLESMSIVTVSKTGPYHPCNCPKRCSVRPGTDSLRRFGNGLVKALV